MAVAKIFPFKPLKGTLIARLMQTAAVRYGALSKALYETKNRTIKPVKKGTIQHLYEALCKTSEPQ